MNKVNNILAMVSNELCDQHAVHKAIYVAEKANAHLTILQLISPHSKFFQSNQEKKTELLQKHIADTVSCLVANVKLTGLNVELKFVEGSSEYKAILNTLKSQHYDLIIKSHKLHHNTHFGMRLEDDWHLLRDIDVPVMLVNGHYWGANAHIVTAIDVDETSEQHNEFNQQILHSSAFFSKILETDVHLLNCYLGEDQSMVIKYNSGDDQFLTQKEIHQQKIAEYSKNLMLPNDHVHIELGLPDDVIPVVAEQCHADIVVIGAGEHHGFSHLFTGHTSEYVIDRLHCDVLALKPEHGNLH